MHCQPEIDDWLTAIIECRQALLNTCRYRFEAHPGPGSHSGWSGTGEGTATPEQDATGTVVRLYETGTFIDNAGHQSITRNVFRFTHAAERISLHHERRGPLHPVWLFDLVADPLNARRLVTDTPHLCGDDRYSAALTLQRGNMQLDWHIQGPRKNEYLRYYYRTA
ncbi:DUF6314 family protein [Larsenimonas rhizosphaerae]|uniref:DUF6314 family protein n=1 Tax=Larsenimonas rhizosphaerae TaxID=2944682 RepID=A0AA42CTM2_9GAMM|nr:DUF6314 family protein [Larsenimonas rhizosphaerae]MCX2523206.1 DUF6314 family protein [Larsenimonas rhizosphaerae]